jgi:hypothetical protein
MSTPGIRTNNPGNLRYNPAIAWQGLATPPHNEDGFCIFTDAAHGLRAVMIDLHSAIVIDGRDTVEEIITHYAPPTENDTDAYIKAVLHWCGWQPGEKPDATAESTYIDMAQAIVVHENGVPPSGTPTAWYDDATYEKAFELTGLFLD